MRSSRLDQARDRVVDAVEQQARERGIDVTLASNLAYDGANLDETLQAYCQILDDLEKANRNARHDDDVGRSVTDSALAGGIDIDDAIQARCEELIDDLLDEAERLALENDDTEASA